MGILHTQLCRLLVHHLHKCRLTARHIFRQTHRGVIGALHSHRFQKIIHRHFFSGLQPNLAAAKARRDLTAGHGISQGYLTVFQRLHKKQKTHDFCNRRRRQLLVGVHFI